MMHNYDTVTEAVNDLTVRGYNEDFNINYDCVYCKKNQERLSPDEFVIDEVYRFEGDTDPDDETIVYAISSTDGKLKGTLINAYGVYSDPVSDELVRKLVFKR